MGGRVRVGTFLPDNGSRPVATSTATEKIGTSGWKMALTVALVIFSPTMNRNCPTYIPLIPQAKSRYMSCLVFGSGRESPENPAPPPLSLVLLWPSKAMEQASRTKVAGTSR
jgi:hypothetical protein